jgi:hypothetical protein
MLVHALEYRCKSLLLLLNHGLEKTSFQHIFVCHWWTWLDSWHWQAPKQSVQVLEATTFLCLHAIHKPADCFFHGGCILSIKKFFILLTGITPVNVLICRWLLGIWHQHVCITLHSSKSCKAGLRSKTTGMCKYIPSTYVLLTKFALVQEQYVFGMHTVHTRGIAMPRAIHCDVAVTAAISPGLPSMYQGNLQQIPCILGMAECCIGSYHAIVQYRLVLL